DKLYVSWDDQYLYIALKTNNTQSWDVAYGIGIDINPGSGEGYTGGSNPSDSWGRSIGFGNGFAVDYEIYFWWSGSSGMGTDNFNTWTGSGWSYNSISGVGGAFAYTGNTSTGLQTIEIKIPWSALGGRPEKMAIMAWVTGGSGSAVDSLPVDPAIDYSNIGNEWGDTDVFTNMALIYPSPKTIDGNLSDWGPSDLIAVGKDNGLAGADLDKLYVSWDDQYLYIALKTNNTQSWDVAYGFGIDVNPGSGEGYTGGSSPSDSWGRSIGFGNGFAVDYEIYFWWSGNSGSITADNFNAWTGSGWNYGSLSDVGAKFAYTGNSSTGLKTLEIAIPWSALGGKHPKFAVMAWVTGGSGSAVDSLPVDPAIDYSNIGDEWSDTDIFTNMLVAEWFLMPDLTVSINGPTVVGLNRVAHYNLTVKNLGSLAADNFSVVLYVDNSTFGEWNLSLGPGGSTALPFNLTFSGLGSHEIKAIVNPNNKIPEANRSNNVALLNVDVIWVGKIDVDGNPSDWPSWNMTPNSYLVKNGCFIWKDAVGDQRHVNVYNGEETDINQYLPGKSSSHADLTEVGVTKDDRYVYFLFKFANMSNIKIGENGATFVAVPIDYKKGGASWFAGEMDTNSPLKWDIQMVINLDSNQYVGQREAIATAGDSKLSLLYFLDPDGNITVINGALVGVNLNKNTIEVRIPVSVFGGARSFNFQVATGFSYGPAVWNFGNPFENDNIPDVVDTISYGPTIKAFTGNVPDYYVHITMNNVIEGASVVNVKVQRIIAYQNTFVMINKFYGIPEFQRDYVTYTTLMEKLSKLPLTINMKKRLNESQSQVAELLELYSKGKSMIDMPTYAFGASLKIYRAYTGLKDIIRELQGMLTIAKSGELQRELYMQELAKNLTKKIDGNLSDWSPSELVATTNNSGLAGANLKALYVDHDNQFLYIALTTRNTQSWRIAYGISLDYKPGGYTGPKDSWGKKMSFKRGIDAQLYFFWNGPFFGSPGTNNITTAQLALWNGTGWVYKDLKWVGFYAYTGGSNGLQTLEIAIPWKALGGKPKELYITAYITGQGVGDSAVDAVPNDPSVHNRPVNEEWTDADTISNFAKVVIS
ncbi:CARDB domain-containing protein, partial [Thermococcus sp.]|uniref:CARDB domain-containing protein n=1 Tax=Thermococcus sp. TaxID=35749 RepID=UPI0025F4CF58